MLGIIEEPLENREGTDGWFLSGEISGYDREIRERIKQGWDHVAKPLDSLGTFEEVISRIGAIQGRIKPELGKAGLLVCCADNGIVEEGISQSGQEITAICAENIANGRSSVGIMAARTGIDVWSIDVGINTTKELQNVLDKKVRKGTSNFLKEPAMTRGEALQAMRTGISLVEERKKEGYSLLGIGEMGIGNTTTSSAITAALLGMPVEDVTGRGAGLSDEKLIHKRNVIQKALIKYGYDLDGGKERRESMNGDVMAGEYAMEVLSNIGGLDIACMAGICIGGALCHVPIVLDGFISLVAALVACRILPVTGEYLIASHSGKEPAIKALEAQMGLSPVLYANMALGEGTGAVLMMSLLRTVNAVYEESVSFENTGIEQYQRYDARVKRSFAPN